VLDMIYYDVINMLGPILNYITFFTTLTATMAALDMFSQGKKPGSQDNSDRTKEVLKSFIRVSSILELRMDNTTSR
jgi:hypothetical protein